MVARTAAPGEYVHVSHGQQAHDPVEEPSVDTWGSFPSDSEYADFRVIIERPRSEAGVPILNRGWDILYEKHDGSAGYNVWADDLAEVAWFFRDVGQIDPKELKDLPAWVSPGKFAGVVWDDGARDKRDRH